MSTIVRTNIGTTSTQLAEDYGKRWVFSLSNGNVLALVRDFTGAGNANERFLVYESTDRVAWTLRATITPATGCTSVSATVDSANNLNVVYLSGDGRTLRHMTVTYGTWEQSAWDVLQTLAAGQNFKQFDIDVSDAGQAVVGAMFTTGAGGTYGWAAYIKATSPGWMTFTAKVLHTNAFVAGAETISVCAAGNVDIGGVTYTNIALAVGYSETIPGANPKPTDRGVNLYMYRVRPTTGAMYEPNVDAGRKGNVVAGQANGASKIPQGRLARFFRDPDDADKIILGIMHSEVNRQMWAGRLSFELGLQLVTPANTVNNSFYTSKLGMRYMGMTFSGGTLMFIYAPLAGVGVKVLGVYTARLTSSKEEFVMQPRTSYFIQPNGYIANQNVDLVLSGGQRNGQSTKADTLFHTYKSGANQKFYHEYAKVTGIPNTLTPAQGSTTSSSNPTVTAKMDFDVPFMQDASTVEFQFATDSGFTTSVITARASAYDVIDGTDKNDGSIIGMTLSQAYSLSAGQTWYMRARNVDSFGNTGNWSASVSFTVAHPPSASNLSPNNNKSLAWGTSGKVDFRWDFNDTSETDSQTAYRLRIYNRNTSALVYDSNKVASSNKFATLNLDNALKNIPLEWEVSLWDSFDSQGAYSGRAQFAVYEAPVVTITLPTQGEAVATPVPHVEFSIATAAGATIKNYRVVVTQSGQVKWDTGVVSANNAPSGTAFAVDAPSTIYRNNQNYTITVIATDSRDVQTSSAPRLISALWVPPAAPTAVPEVDVTLYDLETAGYVSVIWTDAGKDPEFIMYSLQRRDDMIDTNTGDVLETGEWKEIAQIFENDSVYEYQDYIAPSGYRVNYRLAQGVARFNDVVTSEGGPSTECFPVSSAYWLVDPEFGGDTNDAFKLHNVTADGHTNAYERSEYLVIGRGMHVDVGERMGLSGTLNAQLRDSGGTTARQKRLALESIQDESRTIYLRNPFGDVIRISLGDMSITRIPGTGLSEFSDITIPYREVSV